MTDKLRIYKWGNILQNCLDRTEKIKYFNSYSSIKTIKDKLRNSFNFKFEFVSTDIVLGYNTRGCLFVSSFPFIN